MQVTLFRKSVPVSFSARSAKRLSPSILPLVSAFLFTFTAVLSQAQHNTTAPDYTSIVVFGDSLSDTGNVAHLTQTKYGFRLPGPEFDYTDGRFTDGADTLPPAENYWGVWIEQLAASLPAKPAVKNSLNGGTDYAYGFAFTGTGTSVLAFGPSNAYTVNVNNIGLQIKQYLATHPKITNKTLFVVWGGANDILNATSEEQIIDAGINQALNIQALINAGATQFLIPNLPPLGAIPRLNGSPAEAAAATQASEIYNQILALTVTFLQELNSGNNLQLVQLDVFKLFDQIIASPAKFDLVDVTDSSQGIDVNPDTFLFWDGLHPTTHGHNILATTAEKLLSSAGGATSTRPAHEADLTALRTKVFTKLATEHVLVVH